MSDSIWSDQRFLTDPYPQYDRWRSLGRAVWDEDARAWCCTHYDDVAELLSDDERLSSARFARGAESFTEEQREELMPFLAMMSQLMFFKDGTEHARLKKPINRGFDIKVVAHMRPRIEAIVDDLLRHSGDGPVDLISDFARPLPAMVIAEMMGMPTGDLPLLLECTDNLAEYYGSVEPTFELARRAMHGTFRLKAYFEKLIDRRRKVLGDDLISHMIRVEEGEKLLTPAEVAVYCIMITFAGHETTRNLIGNTMHALLSKPGLVQLGQLHVKPELITDAVEEGLRFESPAQYASRKARVDFTLGDRTIEAGSTVLLFLGAANRDPRAFDQPGMLDVGRGGRTRDGRPHVAFGHGPHFCSGARLARLEAQIAIREVVARQPHLVEVDGAAQWLPNPLFRGLASLHVTFSC